MSSIILSPWDKEHLWWSSETNDFGLPLLHIMLCGLPICFLLVSYSILLPLEKCRNSTDSNRHDSQRQAEDRDVASTPIRMLDDDKQAKSEGVVTRVCKEPWSIWRQGGNAAFALVSAVSFVSMMLATQVYHQREWSTSIFQGLGSGELALGGIAAACVFHKETIKSPVVSEARFSRRLNVLRLFWLLTTVVTLLRFQSACRFVAPQAQPIFWMIFSFFVTFLQGLVAIITFILFFRSGKPREHPEEKLKEILFSDEQETVLDAKAKQKVQPPSSEYTTAFWSILTFNWLTPLFRKGRKNLLEITDIWSLKKNDTAVVLYARFRSIWTEAIKNEANTKSRWLLVKCLFKFAMPRMAFAAGAKLLYDCFTLMDPLFLNLLVTYMGEGSGLNGVVWGLLAVGLLTTSALMQTILLHRYFHLQISLGLQFRSALATAVYEKAINVDRSRVDSETAEQLSSGRIVNLMSTDTQRLYDLMSYFHIVWSAPFQITIISVLLYRQLGLAALAGIGVMIAALPITRAIGSRMKRLQRLLMAEKDTRLKVTNESLTGIKAIKFYTWEEARMKEILAVREKELSILKRAQRCMIMYRAQAFGIPCLVCVVSFTVFTAGLKKDLTPAIAFTSLALFNLLRFPLVVLPLCLVNIAESLTSVERLQKFFLLSELLPKPFVRTEPGKPNVEVNGVNLTCGEESLQLVSDVSLTAATGTVTAIVGSTGCGKTTLINAIIGDVKPAKGDIIVRGGVAFCAQTAWIQSGSVRENILFGSQYKKSKYDRVLDACALLDDMKILTDGDATEIGERGVNLSGGQKQRIALARAVYKDAEVYILDDVLSAVDAHVAEHIFQKVFKGVLKDKCVLLITHRLENLRECSQVLFLHGGQARLFTNPEDAFKDDDFVRLAVEVKISEEDETKKRVEENELTEPRTPRLSDNVSRDDSRLRSRTSSVYQRRYTKDSGDISRKLTREDSTLLQRSSSIQVGEETALIRSLSKSSSKEVIPQVLVDEERVEVGAVSWSVYKAYFKACGGYIMIIALLVMLVFSSSLQVGGNFWLSYWSDHVKTLDKYMALGVYTAFNLTYILLVVLANFVQYTGALKAGRKFHKELLDRILRSTVGFFDSTPIGRLMNRFSKDLYVIDESVPNTMWGYLQNVIQVLAVIVVICIVLPWLVLVVAPLLVVYLFVERLYVRVARQLKRIDSVTRSPIFSHFSESIDGATTIRAFRVKSHFRQVHLELTDVNNSAGYVYAASNRWLSVRLESIGTSLVTAVALASVLSRGKVSAAASGLAISYAISITNSLNWLVRMSGDRESDIVSVERLAEYNDLARCPQEKYKGEPMGEIDSRLHGQVAFENVSLRYRDGLPFALKGVSFVIAPGKKVGVVGRTGAGKSSLLVCLLRLCTVTDGSIYVHGRPADPLSVTDLRRQMSIIPQDAVLFTGSLRSNLDPFNESTDDMIWDALKLACLDEHVKNNLNGDLNSMVIEAGSNFSAGQRQLLCLARVLLKKSKILLLDEATSAVDPFTDSLIQETLRTSFTECTVLTIAHRIKTVMDYDEIIVMADGKIAEFGPPHTLSNDPKTIFSQMVSVAGLR